VSEELILGDPRISILEGVVLPWGEPTGYLRKVVLPTLARQFRFDLNTPWGELPETVRECLLHGDAGNGRKKKADGTWEGIVANVERRYDETDSDMVRMELEAYMLAVPCPECEGRRLKPESLAVTIDGVNIGAVTELPITEALAFFDRIPVRGDGRVNGLDPEIAGPILKEVRERLRFLVDVGLDYLTLGRSAESLSGGEAQRIRLATQIGSRLVGVLYILDEPSIVTASDSALSRCPSHVEHGTASMYASSSMRTMSESLSSYRRSTLARIPSHVASPFFFLAVPPPASPWRRQSRTAFGSSPHGVLRSNLNCRASVGSTTFRR
jgi:excinuclease UvrABC ATPase subunit